MISSICMKTCDKIKNWTFKKICAVKIVVFKSLFLCHGMTSLTLIVLVVKYIFKRGIVVSALILFYVMHRI